MDKQKITAMKPQHQEVQVVVEAELFRLIRDRDALLVVAKRVYAELDNIYDVDQGTDGSRRESPFSGAGELMRSLKRVIEMAEQGHE